MPVASSVRALVFLALAVASAACERGAGRGGDSSTARAPGEAARAWAIGIDRARPQLTRKEWRSEVGEAAATLSGFSAGDTLRLVREVLEQGARGRRAARYYFDGAQLRYFESEGSLAPATSESPGAARKERLVLAFDGRGATVEALHQIDGATAPLDSAQIHGVVSRAAELARQWATSPAAPPKS